MAHDASKVFGLNFLEVVMMVLVCYGCGGVRDGHFEKKKNRNKKLLDTGHCLFVAAHAMRFPSAKNNLPANNDLICSGAPAVPVV